MKTRNVALAINKLISAKITKAIELFKKQKLLNY